MLECRLDKKKINELIIHMTKTLYYKIKRLDKNVCLFLKKNSQTGVLKFVEIIIKMNVTILNF